MDPAWVLVISLTLQVGGYTVPTKIEIVDRDGLGFRTELSCKAYERDLKPRLPREVRERATLKCEQR